MLETSDVDEFIARHGDPGWQQIAEQIVQLHLPASSEVVRCPIGENVLFFVASDSVLKIYSPGRRQFERELRALQMAQHVRSAVVPHILHQGLAGRSPYLVMSRVTGSPFREIWPSLSDENRQRIAADVGAFFRELHTVAQVSDGDLASWQSFIDHQIATSLERQRAAGVPERWLAELPAYLNAAKSILTITTARFLHGDVHGGNILLQQKEGEWRLAAVFDFADSLVGAAEYDFVAPSVLMFQGNGELQRAMFASYGGIEIDRALRRRLMLLTILYECSDLRKYALRLSPESLELSLEEFERALYPFV